MSKKKSKSSKKVEVDEKRPHTINEKPYITEEIETSITLLESPENKLVLEALLFLSKYADIQRNNLQYVQSRGLLPKLLALLDHNICILRVTLRLLSQLLTVELAQVELRQEKFDQDVIKICRFYVSHPDLNIKEFAVMILATYSALGRSEIFLPETALLTAILKNVKNPENDNILHASLQLFYKLIEFEEIRQQLSKEKDFNLDVYIERMQSSENSLRTILGIFEKLSYFSDDDLQNKFKECKVVEHLFNIIIDPERLQHAATCLNIIIHCMNNDNTKSNFVTSLEFLKFNKWVKTCPVEFMSQSVKIFLELSKIDQIRQMLFDLSVEDTILSFLRSDDKKILNPTCEAMSFMSKHKYCCEQMVTPVVIKKLLQMLQTAGDTADCENETALTTLYYFSRRESRTIHMIRTYEGIPILLAYLRKGTDKLSEYSYCKLLEMANMFVTNNQLQRLILSPDLYDVILAQTSSKFDEICMRSLEIMINCLNHKDFQNYFLLNNGSQVLVDKLAATTNEQIVRFLIIFIHNALMEEKLAKDLVYKKLLLVLKKLPDNFKYSNPLIQRVINLIYDLCLPVKFFETGRLELSDTINERFYLINGPWNEPFPFLEVLELRQMSTLSTIYVVDECIIKDLPDSKSHDCLSLQRQSLLSSSTTSSINSLQAKCVINYGLLSHDPYLPIYVKQVEKLMKNAPKFEAKVKLLAEYVNECLCGPEENSTVSDKLHTFKLHIECIKKKLGTNMIPIGYLRLGFHCERALLFKALADYVCLPVTLVKGKKKLYWNEVALLRCCDGKNLLKWFVVDLMNKIGQLLPVGSRECNAYCDIQ